MAYNPNNAKEEPMLPADVIFDGVVINIADGKVKDFVKNLAKWSQPEQPAINVNIEVMHNEQKFNFDQLFTFKEENGQTVYSPRSLLGKYKAKYQKLPTAGDQVKVMTNNEGFLRLKLD